MKIKIIFLAFLLSIFLFTSASSASITCNSCSVGNCQCSITDCSSGTFGAYIASDCSEFPNLYLNFTGGTVSWPPFQARTYYLKAFCDGFNSLCTPQIVSSESTTSTTTTTEPTSTTISSTSTTVGSAAECSKEGHVCTERTPCCYGLSCVSNYCIKTSTTTTIQTTTTTISTTTVPYEQKEECTSECCVGKTNYYDKFCENEEATCVDGECVIPGPIIDYSLIGIIIIVIIVVLVAIFLFFRGRNESDGQEQVWNALKKKWKGQLKKFFQR